MSQPRTIPVRPDVYGAYGPDETYHCQYAEWVAALKGETSRRALLEILFDVPADALIETIEFPIDDAGRAFGVFLDGEWMCDWGWESGPREYADWIEITERGAGTSI